MSDHDRINEVYHGKLFGQDIRRIAQERVHWMCSQIRGNRVLDIGCSQGIVSIIAAREGHEVTGVDVNESVIDVAQSELASEHESVKRRLRFLNGDIHDDILSDEKFDTVLLGEILEHYSKPGRLLARACEFLLPTGRIVGTTPFGYHAHDDHKHTFYLTDFLATFADTARLTSVDIIDGYVRFTADLETDAPCLVDPAEILALTEVAILKKELHTHTNDLRRVRQIRELKKARDGAQTTAEQLDRKLQILQDQVEGLRDQVQRKQLLNDQLAAEIRILNRSQSQWMQMLEEERKKARAVIDKQTASADKPASSESGSEASAEPTPAPEKKAAAAAPEKKAAKSGAGASKSHAAAKSGGDSDGQPGALRRGTSTLIASVQRELRTGRARTEPVTALKKTYARVRRSVLNLPPPQAADTVPKPPKKKVVTRKPAARPKSKKSLFPAYEPSIAPRPVPITVATILDTFSQHCLKYEANIVALTIDGWREEIQRTRPTFFLAESAWRGNDGQWKYLMTKYRDRAENPLRDLIAYCREHSIPTVFWNKEDPVNFEVFKDVAAEFDYVFTTDARCIPRYKEIVPHDRVYALPFAAQPAIHNPITQGKQDKGNVCFAGSWRADKYPERVKDMQRLLRPALKYDVEIFDRFFDTPGPDGLQFPAMYKKAVKGALDYDNMLSAYRSYKVFLNVNSVKDSPTMFSRRVFELMACNTPVISSPSEGITHMLGTLVKEAGSEKNAIDALKQLLNDEAYRARFAHSGYREVLSKHTYAHRMRKIFEVLNLPHVAADAPVVTVLAATNRPERLRNLLDNVRRQVHQPVELIILLNSDAFDRSKVERAAAGMREVRIASLPESYTLAECLNHGIDMARGEFIAKFDDDDYYGAHYLSDLLLATRYTDAGVIGKRTYFCHLEGTDDMALRFPGKSHRHVEFVHGATLLIRRSVLDEVRFTPVRQGTDTIFLRECRAKGYRIYSADPYNFIHVRHADLDSHTWKINDSDFLAKCEVLRKGLDMGAVMI